MNSWQMAKPRGKNIDHFLVGAVLDHYRISGKKVLLHLLWYTIFPLSNALLLVTREPIHGITTWFLFVSTVGNQVISPLSVKALQCHDINQKLSQLQFKVRETFEWWSRGPFSHPMNVNIDPSCSINDGNNCPSSHHCTHDACENKVHANESDKFVDKTNFRDHYC